MRPILSAVLAFSLISPLGAQGPAPAPRPRSALPAAASAAVASVTALQGSVEIRRADGSTEGVVSAASLVLPGDEVRVPPNGRATVRFNDGSEVQLEASSVFVVREAEPKLFSMFLGVGKLWASVTKNARRRFEVRTPTAVASVRGTQFSIEVKSPKETIALVRTGLVAVQGLVDGRATGSEAFVSAGHFLNVLGGHVGPIEEIHGMLPAPAAPATKEAAAPKAEPAVEKAQMKVEVARELAAQAIKEAAQGNAVSASANPQAPEGATLMQATAYQQSMNAAQMKPAGVAAPGGAPQPVNAGALPTLPPPGTPATGTAPPVQSTITQPPAPIATSPTSPNPVNTVVPVNSNYSTLCPNCPPPPSAP